jgi:hypothetical protein
MNTIRLNTLIVGILFIVGTAAGVMAVSIESPILDVPDYLLRISANEVQITTGAFLQFLMAISCAGIGLSLYPLIKKYSEGLAIAVVGFRIMEGMAQILGSAIAISLLALSQAYGKAGAAAPAFFQTLGTVIKAGNDWLNNGPIPLCWCIAAVIYYSVFYQYKLVPRWLSAWGLIGISLTMLLSVLNMLNILPAVSTVQMAVNLPIAVQEMVFAVWLIVKGINPSAAVYPSVNLQLNKKMY